MKKKELKKRIEDGFSELSPDLFEAVLEESRKQEVVWSEAETEKPSANGKFYMGRFPKYAMSLCASLAIIFLCIFGMLGEKEKSVFMVIDINPSIQVEMDESHQVKRLKGLNQDGKDVVKELKWEKGTVQELVDVLIQDVVEKSYLRENGGILVTLAARDKGICENLERTLGEGIDRKLTELKVSGVTTAFQEVQKSSREKGRKRLETELKKSCGLDDSQVQQMTVNELIHYCQDYTSLELKLSEASEKDRAAGQKKEDKLPKPQNSPQEGESGKKPEESTPGEGNRKEGSDKDKKLPNGAGEKTPENAGSQEQAPQEEKKDKEGNTDSPKIKKPNGSASAGGSAQTGGTAPSVTEDASGQPEGGEPMGSGGSAGQPGSESVVDTPQDSGQPGSGDGSEPSGIVTPGQPGSFSEPGVGTPGQPGNTGQPETDTPGQPGNTGQPETDTPGQPENTGQPGTVLQDPADNSGQPEKEVPSHVVSPNQSEEEIATKPQKDKSRYPDGLGAPERKTPNQGQKTDYPMQSEGSAA